MSSGRTTYAAEGEGGHGGNGTAGGMGQVPVLYLLEADLTQPVRHLVQVLPRHRRIL